MESVINCFSLERYGEENIFMGTYAQADLSRIRAFAKNTSEDIYADMLFGNKGILIEDSIDNGQRSTLKILRNGLEKHSLYKALFESGRQHYYDNGVYTYMQFEDGSKDKRKSQGIDGVKTFMESRYGLESLQTFIKESPTLGREIEKYVFQMENTQDCIKICAFGNIDGLGDLKVRVTWLYDRNTYRCKGVQEEAFSDFEGQTLQSKCQIKPYEGNIVPPSDLDSYVETE